MQDLSIRQPPTLAIAEGATTPDPGGPAFVKSSTTGQYMGWDGSAWRTMSFIHIGNSAPSSPVVGQLWLDTN